MLSVSSKKEFLWILEKARERAENSLQNKIKYTVWEGYIQCISTSQVLKYHSLKFLVAGTCSLAAVRVRMKFIFTPIVGI